MVIKECVVCGRRFDARGRAITCSEKCSEENRKDKMRIYQQTDYYKEYKRKYMREYQKEYIRYNPHLKKSSRENICNGYSEARYRVASKADFKCEITGLKGDVCHHLNSFHWCESGRADVLNLIWISDRLVHKPFHSIYGYTNNTYAQFAEFIQNVFGLDLDKIMERHKDW